MYIVGSYTLAVIFCFVTMLCWGSWGNTQKLAAKSWRYELFYWDYVIGMVPAAGLYGRQHRIGRPSLPAGSRTGQLEQHRLGPAGRRRI